jgi:ubiquinone/menaquinone biosynthesis C-methylase UbiE
VEESSRKPLAEYKLLGKRVRLNYCGRLLSQRQTLESYHQAKHQQQSHRHMKNKRREKIPGAGRSSFSLVDQDKVLGELQLHGGIGFLDLGCGRGEYAIEASEIVGTRGKVYGIDLWEEGIQHLRKEALARGNKNIEALVADGAKKIPLVDMSIDVCFMATVFHDLVLANTFKGALREISRVLKKEGILAILEFIKTDGPPGPPLSSRLAPEEVEGRVIPYGFERVGLKEVGPYNYLLRFVKR